MVRDERPIGGNHPSPPFHHSPRILDLRGRPPSHGAPSANRPGSSSSSARVQAPGVTNAGLGGSRRAASSDGSSGPGPPRSSPRRSEMPFSRMEATSLDQLPVLVTMDEQRCPVCGISLSPSDVRGSDEDYFCPYCTTRKKPSSRTIFPIYVSDTVRPAHTRNQLRPRS